MLDVTISFTENREIGSRITPGLVALVIALAPGSVNTFGATKHVVTMGANADLNQPFADGSP